MVWIISWADYWVLGLLLCQHGEKMCDENTWMWRSFMQASGIPERPMSPPSPSPCCVEYNYTEADICMHHSPSVSLYSPRPGNSPNYTNLKLFWRGQYYYRLLLVAAAVLSDTEGLVPEISVKRECRLLSQLLLLNRELRILNPVDSTKSGNLEWIFWRGETISIWYQTSGL